MHTHLRHARPATHEANKSLIDRAADVMAFASPLLGLPQVVQVFVTHDASGLSLFSWVAFAVVALIFLLYAIKHQIKPLIVAEGLWLVIYLAVIPGILLYG
jgi:uncharacterized protein with PQ loop repeat